MANEKRLDLIDRTVLMNDISQIGVVSLGNVLQCLSTAKTVDAVEVVRCKDCKHYYHSVSSYKDGRCVMFGTYDTDPSVYLNDFCSYGERSEGE